MAFTFGFYNSVNHDRRYNALQMSQLFDGIITDGVFANIGTAMVVTAGSGLTINVGIGRAWFNGTWSLNDAIYPIDAPESDVLLNRIDAVVLEVDQRETTRANRIFIKEGAASTTPKKPDMTKSGDVYQYPLCYINRAAGSAEITQSDIENRVGTSECPFVTGILSTISTDELVKQWTDQFDELFEHLVDAVEQTLAGEVVDGSITTPKIVDGAVTEGKIDPSYTKKTINARNLLDNGDFRNPVNQRGFVSGTTGQSNYTIDRWILQYNTALHLESEGIGLSGRWDLTQHIGHELYAGRVYTFVVKARGETGTESLRLGISSRNSDDGAVADFRNIGTEWKTYSIHWTPSVDSAIGESSLGIGIYNEAGQATKTIVEWAALYEGEHTAEAMPNYQSKGYGAELAECQRYFVRMTPRVTGDRHIAIAHAWTANYAYAILPLPCTMRESDNPLPTVSVPAGSKITIKQNSGAANITPLAITPYALTAASVMVHFQSNNGYTYNNTYIVLLDGALDISKDI